MVVGFDTVGVIRGVLVVVLWSMSSSDTPDMLRSVVLMSCVCILKAIVCKWVLAFCLLIYHPLPNFECTQCSRTFMQTHTHTILTSSATSPSMMCRSAAATTVSRPCT